MILVSVNITEDALCKFDDRADNFLIAAFNKTPKGVSGENIGARKNRAFLLKMTEELNANGMFSYDMLDVMHRLAQLRKAGALAGKSDGE